ncbi:hypothetical protein, partial [Candidatus Symbiopectobacterium sp. NZEC135]|uniref:hypothetical protein n=1 Tax=Candidatus Symbiopectobacterium sp. NZEC135 TaxID=2820471 RepID=UPI00222807DD
PSVSDGFRVYTMKLRQKSNDWRPSLSMLGPSPHCARCQASKADGHYQQCPHSQSLLSIFINSLDVFFWKILGVYR